MSHSVTLKCAERARAHFTLFVLRPRRAEAAGRRLMNLIGSDEALQVIQFFLEPACVKLIFQLLIKLSCVMI